MCEMCGDPNCSGPEHGTSVNDIKYTEESADQATNILQQMITMCMDIEDATGVKQLEKLTEFALNANIRPDKLVLMMVDALVRDVMAKSAMQTLQKEMMKVVQEEKEPKAWEEFPVDNSNKKLN